ncbi:hypothetical protein Dimus_014869 [Dionaea muscipula]
MESCSSLRSLTQLHAHLLVTGLRHDRQASTKLIESYAEMGSLKSAANVFRTHHNPDPFMWCVLIKCFVWDGSDKEAISLYHRMLCLGIQFSAFVFPSILRSCARFGDLGIGQLVHGTVVKCGFEADDVVQTALLSMYGELSCPSHARKVFEEMPIRDVVSWSSMVSCLVKNGQLSEGLEVFREMVYKGTLEVDSVIMLSVAEACGELGFVDVARSIHGYTVRHELNNDDGHGGLLDSSLIVMYGKCGDLFVAKKLFQNVANDGHVSSWTAMISCYNQDAQYREALLVFANMHKSKVEPNSMTLEGVIYTCARLGLEKEGKSCHSYAIRKGIDLEYDQLLGPTLIDLYAECGNPKACQRIFQRVREKDVIMWNMLISVHTRVGLLEDASLLFVQIYALGFLPDSFTISSVLSACGTIGFHQLGSQIHSYIVKTGYSDEFVMNSLIDMYSKTGFLDSARMAFIRFRGRRSVMTWNTMICGYSHNGEYKEAIGLFDLMYSSNHKMDEVTFSSIIQACSNSGCLEKGKWIHHKLIVHGVRNDIYISTALTDMYAKFGDIKTAKKIFNSMKEKSVVSWSAMIAGYGAHGDINAALSLFNEMTESGTKPNEITFLNVLSACSHAGYVEQGKMYYNSMIKDYAIEPRLEHIVCMVDLLSRAGDLEEAYRVIKSTSDASIWGSFLNGCRVHQRIDIIRMMEDDLANLSLPDNTGYYSLLSNIHAEMENWDEFAQIRSTMTSLGLKKVPGYSKIT